MQVYDVEIASNRIQVVFKIGRIVEPSEPPRTKIAHLNTIKVHSPPVRHIAISPAINTSRKYMNPMARRRQTLA
jgi:hypothetical protein